MSTVTKTCCDFCGEERPSVRVGGFTRDILLRHKLENGRAEALIEVRILISFNAEFTNDICADCLIEALRKI